jgi:hypothetical protein
LENLRVATTSLFAQELTKVVQNPKIATFRLIEVAITLIYVLVKLGVKPQEIAIMILLPLVMII